MVFLESNLASMNKNLMDLTTLVKNMVINPKFVMPEPKEAPKPPLVVSIDEGVLGAGEAFEPPPVEPIDIDLSHQRCQFTKIQFLFL